jgi:uncharacterized protein YeaC (DUF1315 family)
MNLQQLLNGITPDIYQQLQKAVETGKWPDGRKISEEQRSLCMQAIIAYDQRNPESERTGYVPPKESACAIEDKPKPIKWDH